jgi:uncharacterized protein YfaP (DUF2135 family)
MTIGVKVNGSAITLQRFDASGSFDIPQFYRFVITAGSKRVTVRTETVAP